jgi:hypothetical protein
VGILLYELFHNIEPFKGETPQDVLKAIMTESLKFDKHCPKEARDLIKYILNIDKNYRPKISQILNHPYLRDDAKSPTHIQPLTPQPVPVAHPSAPLQNRSPDSLVRNETLKPTSDHLNGGQLHLHHKPADKGLVIQSQNHQNGQPIGQRFSMQEQKPQEGQYFGQTRSDKQIPSTEMFSQRPNISNPLRSTAYTVQVNPFNSIQSQPFATTGPTGSTQVASFRAENDKRHPTYAPLNSGHSYSSRSIQKPVASVSEPLRIQSSHGQQSADSRTFSPQAPALRATASHEQAAFRLAPTALFGSPQLGQGLHLHSQTQAMTSRPPVASPQPQATTLAAGYTSHRPGPPTTTTTANTATNHHNGQQPPRPVAGSLYTASQGGAQIWPLAAPAYGNTAGYGHLPPGTGLLGGAAPIQIKSHAPSRL